MTGKDITMAETIIYMVAETGAVLFILGTIFDLIPADLKMIQALVAGIFALVASDKHEHSK